MATAAPPTHDTTVDAQIFWYKYGKELVAVVIVAILAGIGGLTYRLYSERQDDAAAALLAAAKSAADYQKVIDQYPMRPAGGSAYLFLAEAQRKEGKFAESNTTIQAFRQKQPKHELIPASQLTMAANDESLGRIDDALAIYQQIATNYPQSYEAPYAMISQVRLLKAKKQDDLARQACEKILVDYRDSVWATEAMRELRILTPKEAPSAGPGAPAATGNPSAPPLIARPAPANPPGAGATAKPR